MERISIFDIERRKDIRFFFDDWIEHINFTKVSTANGHYIKVIELLEYYIRFWPYRCGASSIKGYLTSIDINLYGLLTDIKIIECIELFVNLLYYAQNEDAFYADEYDVSDEDTTVREETTRLIENAEYILEQCLNMCIRKRDADGEVPQYRITKRDVDVDATIEAAPELSEVLLEYLDIRNENSIDFKEDALLKLHKYMEPKRGLYKGLTCSAISEEFFNCMNNLKGIRHNKDGQIDIPEENRNDVYDKLFKMALYVLRTEEVNVYKDEMKELRSGS